MNDLSQLKTALTAAEDNEIEIENNKTENHIKPIKAEEATTKQVKPKTKAFIGVAVQPPTVPKMETETNGKYASDY